MALERWSRESKMAKRSGTDRISGTRGVSVQWRALDTFRRLENICPRGDQKPPFVLSSGAKIKRHSRPARPARKRQRIRGGNEPPQKKRRWMLRILGSTAINQTADSSPLLLSFPLPIEIDPSPFLKRGSPFFPSNVFCEANSSLPPFWRQ